MCSAHHPLYLWIRSLKPRKLIIVCSFSLQPSSPAYYLILSTIFLEFSHIVSQTYIQSGHSLPTHRLLFKCHLLHETFLDISPNVEYTAHTPTHTVTTLPILLLCFTLLLSIFHLLKYFYILFLYFVHFLSPIPEYKLQGIRSFVHLVDGLIHST